MFAFEVYNINPLKSEFHMSNIYKFRSYLTGNSVFITETNWLTLSRELIADCSDDHMKTINTDSNYAQGIYYCTHLKHFVFTEVTLHILNSILEVQL
jgi:hypothetical protein